MTPWPYDLTAEFYDEDMGRTANGRDVAWYVAGATAAAARSGRILELGSGTGRVTLPLAAAGLHVVAVDRSPPMLRRLVRKAAAAGINARILALAMDMGRLSLAGSFAAVLCPYSAFGYLVKPADRQRLLASVLALLRPGGVFLLDCFIPDPALRQVPDDTPIFDYRRPLPEGPWHPAVTLERHKRLTWDVLPNVNRIRRLYRFLDAENRLVREVHTDTLQYAYPPERVLDLLRAAGFETVSGHGDFDPLTRPAPPARVMAATARKAGG